MSDTPSGLPALPYLPSSVRIVPSRFGADNGLYDVVDTDGTWYATECSKADANRWATRRRGVVKAAITRRANKARVARELADTALAVRRAAACSEAGVTWTWLTTGVDALTSAEADAWLGLD